MKPKQKAFRPLRVKLSEVSDPAAREKLENMFMNLQGQRALMVQEAREAARHDAKRMIHEGEARVALIEFTQELAEHFDPAKTEAVWVPYRKDGEIIVECPFAEQDMLNSMKLQRAQMNKAAENLETDGDDLYGGEGDSPEES